MNNNLIAFFKQRPDLFPFSREIDLERFLVDVLDEPDSTLPIPAKIFLVDELAPHSYGYPVSKAQALDDLEQKAERWLDDEVLARTGSIAQKSKADESFRAYRNNVVSLAQNAIHSSILADYHSVFWLMHSQQLARLFTAFPRRAVTLSPQVSREQADVMKYLVFSKWAAGVRDALPEIAARVQGSSHGRDKKMRFVRLLTENALVVTEDFVSADLRELRSYFGGFVRRDYSACKKWFDDLRARTTDLLERDRLFRRALTLLGYPDSKQPGLVMLLDRRVQQLLLEHPSAKPIPDQGFYESLSRRILEYLVVQQLRRGIAWMHTTSEGENVSEELGNTTLYSRAIRPMNFGRRGIVEPIVYRYGLVYDITSFTQTLGEIARGGKNEEQGSYRQMLEFQRELADITNRHGLQFEKFLGDGAFYTSRRATRTLHAAVDIQQFYSQMKSKGFAFNKGMRIALNYGYYRLLPMQVASDGTEIKEFYGPGIVELSRLTTGKATKEIEDIQQLLLSHGYDQMEVYRFFAPLSRDVDTSESALQQREFYAYVNANGHLINEGLVVSIPFLKQLAQEILEDQQKLYRLRAPWASYIGLPGLEGGTYVGLRMLGAVQLKGIGNVEVAEAVRLTNAEAEVSVIEEARPLLQLLQQERNRSAARFVDDADIDVGASDLVVCESHMQSDGPAVIYVGEWDPVSEEVRRPIQLGGDEAERYGLAVPLTAEAVELQSVAYQKLYRKLSRIETLPSFSVNAIKQNVNFSGFIIGATVERL